jgi:hypothetical protein
VTSPHVQDATHATFYASVAPHTTNSKRSVTWTNPNGTNATCLNCILAIDSAPPTIAYIGPSDKFLTEIWIVAIDENAFIPSGSKIAVTRAGVPVAFTTRTETWPDDPSVQAAVLTLATPQNGLYKVTVTPKDSAGNVGPMVTKYVQRGEKIVELNAYGTFQGGAETTAGDVNGDGVDEIITAAGPGGGPHVRVFKVNYGRHTTTEVGSFMAYDPAFTGGVRVASADVDGDGTDEVVTAPGPGGGPHVRVWHVLPGGGVVEYASFLAYAPGVTTGLSISGGDVDGNGQEEVITAPGAGVGPHVRAFTISGRSVQEAAGFMAYDPAFTGGVRVTALDVNGDGISELATGAGPGGGPHVQIFTLDAQKHAQAVASFMAYDPAFTGGVVVSSGDFNGDWFDELVVSAGGGGGPHVRILAFDDDGTIFEAAGFMAYDPNFHGGVSAAGGDVDGDGDDDIITTPGPGMPVQIIARRVI